MKRFFYFFLLISITLLTINVNAEEFELNSSNVILYNMNDNSIIYEKASDEKVSIASLTKIMTAIVAVENINNLDDKVVIDTKDFAGLAEANLATAGFKIGEEVTYRDLLYGLLFPSGAEAAQALTRLVAGNNEEFVKLMNEKAKELKLSNTHFANPTGLDDEEHYSTVKDVSVIFKYALDNKDLNEIIRNKTYTTSNNRLSFKSPTTRIPSTYNLEMDYLDGGKTGTTGDAGLCLASIAHNNGINYMLVTVRAPYTKGNPLAFRDAKTIYEYYMNNYGYQKVVSKDDVILTLKTQYTKNDKIEFKAEKDIMLYLKNDYDHKAISYKYSGVKTITHKLKKNTKLGVLKIHYKDILIEEVDVILAQQQKLDIKKYLLAHKKYVFIILVIILVIVLFISKKTMRSSRN